jgi:endonuclease-8
MPEGDTIFRTARTLHMALAGRLVTSFETVLPALQRVHDDHPITGRTVAGVRSAGKHLLIELSDGLVLRTHMRMSGSWHIYRPGERWRRSRAAMRIVLGTVGFEAVAFDVPIAEFIATRDINRHRDLAALGPDLLADRFEPAAAAARIRARPDEAIADVLLDQRAVAGLGNVYKSEVLFSCGLDPWRTVSSLSDDEVARVLDRARALLEANVVRGTARGVAAWRGRRRTTRSMDPGARLFVYGRTGRPCRRCGTPIAHRRQGSDARGTWWCPKCQG